MFLIHLLYIIGCYVLVRISSIFTKRKSWWVLVLLYMQSWKDDGYPPSMARVLFAVKHVSTTWSVSESALGVTLPVASELGSTTEALRCISILTILISITKQVNNRIPNLLGYNIYLRAGMVIDVKLDVLLNLKSNMEVWVMLALPRTVTLVKLPPTASRELPWANNVTRFVAFVVLSLLATFNWSLLAITHCKDNERRSVFKLHTKAKPF